MKLRGLLIAIIVLAGLTGALYWSNRHPKSAETSDLTVSPVPKILSLKEDDVSRIDIKKKGGAELLLAKNNGKWQITAPQPLSAEQAAVAGMLATLSSLSAERLVEERSGNLSQYGLAAPAFEAVVTEKDNKAHKLLLGDNTPTGNAVYAQLAGDPRVFTIASSVKNSINKTANDLRDKRLLTVDPEKISRITLTAKKQDIEFGRNKDEWQIVKPKPLRADGSQVEQLVRTLTDARMELSGTDSDEKKTAAAFSSASPVATAQVTTESGTQELQIRKSKDDYYAKSSAVAGFYKVASSLGTGLDKSLDDFRNKKLFDFGFNDPSKIEIHDGSKAYFLTRTGGDWWNGSGARLDSGTVQSLLDKIRDLSASKFIDSGFTTATMDLSVTSNDGKRPEKVSISRAGDNYIARRENEPALYQLDSNAVADLQKSAEDLKAASPAAAPKPAK